MVICSWHGSCYIPSVLIEHEYGSLTRERDRLVGLQGKASLPKHKIMIKEQLTDIRKQLKEAHHERYHRTKQA